MDCCRCGALIRSGQLVEPVRDDAGQRRYRHRDVCTPLQPPPQQDNAAVGVTLATGVGGRPQPLGWRGRLDKKVDVLALWQELLGRKLTADELLRLFSDHYIIAMLKTPVSTALEAGQLAAQAGGLNLESWHEWTRRLEKRHKASGSLSLVLEGRNEKYAHHPHQKIKTGLGPTQNYNDDT